MIGIAVALPAEQTGNPILTSSARIRSVSATQAGGNMEGKEVRFGITDSALLGGDHDRHLDGRGQ